MPDTNDTELYATAAKMFAVRVIDERDKGSGNKTAVRMWLPREVRQAIGKVRRANDLKKRDATRLFADELERLLKHHLRHPVTVTSGTHSINVRFR